MLMNREHSAPAAALRQVAGSEWEQDVAAWRTVHAASADANAFASHLFVGASLDNLAHPLHRIAVIPGSDGQPIGVAPLTIRHRFGRFPVRHVALWGHPNMFLAPAAAVAGAEPEFWRGLCAALSGEGCGPMLVVEGLASDSALYAGLVSYARTARVPLVIEQRIRRAMITEVSDPEAYWSAAVNAKKRKELRRQWARLAEQGVLTVDLLPPTGDPLPWIDEFLTLEQSGWKGRQGSALASDPATAAFFRAAITSAHAARGIAATAIRIDGRAIAMLWTLIDKGAGFSFKTAYDERYARFSPGVLLQRESLTLVKALGLSFVDSCAAEDHPMIDSLWRERREILTVSLPLPGRLNRAHFHAIQAAKHGWHRIKTLRSAG